MAENAMEQVVIRFIADNASYLKSIAESQQAIKAFVSSASPTIDRLEKTIKDMGASFDKVSQNVNRLSTAVEKISIQEAKLATQYEKTAAAIAKKEIAEINYLKTVEVARNRYLTTQEKTAQLEIRANALVEAEKIKSANKIQVSQLKLQEAQVKQATKEIETQNKVTIAQIIAQAKKETAIIASEAKIEAAQINANARVAASVNMANKARQEESNMMVRAISHYTSIGSQLGYLIRQYVSLYVVIGTIKQVVNEGISFLRFKEETTMAFTVMMRSADAAKSKIAELYEFAVRSPLTFKEVTEASRQLMAYGFAAHELVNTMKLLGTVGKAVGVSMNDMAYVYGTLRAQGRAYTRDLMQFAMRGIPIYEELASVMGVSVSKIQKLTSEGKVGFAEVEAAFNHMVNSGGKFSGMLDQYMNTLSGRLSMLTDLAQKSAGQLTKPLFDYFKNIVDQLIAGFESGGFDKIIHNLSIELLSLMKTLAGILKLAFEFKSVIFVFLELKVVYNILDSLIPKLITVYSTLHKIIPLVARFGVKNIAGALLNMMSPLTAITAGLTALISLIPLVINLINKAKQEEKELMQQEAITPELLNKASEIYNKQLATLQAKYGVETFISGSLVTQSALVDIIAKKYDISRDRAVEILVANKNITVEMAEQVKKLQKYDIMEQQRLERMSQAFKPSYPKAIKPDVISWLADETKLDEADVSEAIFEKQADNSLSITKYIVKGANAAKLYVQGFAESLKNNKALSKLIGEQLEDSDIKQILNDQLSKLKTFYLDLQEKIAQLGSADAKKYGLYDASAILVERMKVLVSEIQTFDKLKKQADELNKALENYKKNIAEIQRKISLNDLLGFNPTEIEKLRAEFQLTITDIRNGVGDFANWTKNQQDTYIDFLQKVLDFDIGKIEFNNFQEYEKQYNTFLAERETNVFKQLNAEHDLALKNAAKEFSVKSEYYKKLQQMIDAMYTLKTEDLINNSIKSITESSAWEQLKNLANTTISENSDFSALYKTFTSIDTKEIENEINKLYNMMKDAGIATADTIKDTLLNTLNTYKTNVQNMLPNVIKLWSAQIDKEHEYQKNLLTIDNMADSYTATLKRIDLEMDKQLYDLKLLYETNQLDKGIYEKKIANVKELAQLTKQYFEDQQNYAREQAITSLQENVIMNKTLGYNPSEIAKLTYNYEKAVKDVKQGLNDFAHYTAKQKDDYIKYLDELYRFDIGKIRADVLEEYSADYNKFLVERKNNEIALIQYEYDLKLSSLKKIFNEQSDEYEKIKGWLDEIYDAKKKIAVEKLGTTITENDNYKLIADIVNGVYNDTTDYQEVAQKLAQINEATFTSLSDLIGTLSKQLEDAGGTLANDFVNYWKLAIENLQKALPGIKEKVNAGIINSINSKYAYEYRKLELESLGTEEAQLQLIDMEVQQRKEEVRQAVILQKLTEDQAKLEYDWIQKIGDLRKKIFNEEQLKARQDRISELTNSVSLSYLLGYNPTEIERLQKEFDVLIKQMRSGMGEFAGWDEDSQDNYLSQKWRELQFNIGKIQYDSFKKYEADYKKFLVDKKDNEIALLNYEYDLELKILNDTLKGDTEKFNQAKTYIDEIYKYKKQKAIDSLMGDNETLKKLQEIQAIPLNAGTDYESLLGNIVNIDETSIEELRAFVTTIADELKQTDAGLANDFSKKWMTVIDDIVKYIQSNKDLFLQGLADQIARKNYLEYYKAEMESIIDQDKARLDIFDTELNLKLEELQIIIDTNTEKSAAAKLEYDWAVKIGALQRRNLIEQLNLTKARKFLEGNTDEMNAFWNRMEVRLAVGLGMKKYAEGTGAAKPGMALVGEKGPELIMMKGGETVIPNHMLHMYAKGTIADNNYFLSSQDASTTSSDNIKEIVESIDKRAKSLGKILPTLDNLGTVFKGLELDKTQAGKMLAGAATGAPLGASVGPMVLADLAKFVASIENVNKVLNPFSTILEGARKIIEPLMNDALQPLVDILMEVGQEFGQVLAPVINLVAIPLRIFAGILKITTIPLKMVGKAFEWLNDKVIVPVGNFIIDMINGLIKIINKLPFVDIAYLDHLQTVKEATEGEKLIAKGNKSLTDTLKYLNDKLQAEVDKQIGSYKDLYELGLITASEYEANVKRLNETIPKESDAVSQADMALSDMADIAARIKQLMDVQKQFEDGNLTNMEILNILKNNGLISYAVGTPNIPADMTAKVHAGEMIVPRTFADSIRSGELVLSGGGNSSSTVYNVNVNVAGSVQTENDLAVTIAKAIKKQTVRGYV